MKNSTFEEAQKRRGLDRSEHPIFNLWLRAGMILTVIVSYQGNFTKELSTAQMSRFRFQVNLDASI